MGQNFSSEPVVDKETERAENETFKAAVSSCQGWRMRQEDNHSLMLELPNSEHKASFFAVYDGHGSARISKHASEDLWRHLTQNPLYKKGNFKEALEQSFLSFDKEVSESSNAQLAGTTAICVLVVDNVIYCANIGDSRAVVSVNCECEPLSYDHKPDNPDELKRILNAGGYVLGNRVNGNLALSRAFGDFHYKANGNLGPEDQIVSPYPDIKRVELNEDVDFIVLACDGIWDVLTNEEVVSFVISRLEQNIEPALICEQLTERCLATDYELVIGCDNMTVLLVCHTRGRSWADYCTDIFNKNTKRLGVPRTRSFNPEDLHDDTDVHRRRQQQLREQHERRLVDEVFGVPSTGQEQPTFSGDSSSQPNAGSLFDSRIPDNIRMVLDVFKSFDIDANDGDEPERITEISSNNEIDSIAKTTGPNETISANTESLSEDDDQQAVETSNHAAKESDIVNKTNELHLSAPDDNTEDETAQGDGQDVQDEAVEKTIEIELAAPKHDTQVAPDLDPDAEPGTTNEPSTGQEASADADGASD